MRRVFIGHRGVGKTSLLARHQDYFPQISHFDLDTEIEADQKQKISNIFQNQGESAFREIELSVFKQLIQKENFVISLGAGFPTEHLSSIDCEVIWVRRSTDSDGRIFLNRPRLNPDLSALEEYQLRYLQREPRYLLACDFVYDMPEGITGSDEIEKQIFQPGFVLQTGRVALLPNKMKSIRYFKNIELRTDLFSSDEIRRIQKNYPDKNFVVSYRKSQSADEIYQGACDWALELGPVPEYLKKENLVVSIHDGSVEQGVQKLSSYLNYSLKLCPVIENWSELEKGHEWQQQDPLRRSFLPRTAPEQSRPLWQWYREWQIDQPIQFCNQFQNIMDQPSVYRAVQFEHYSTNPYFGAVLGFPVHHSKTPVTQQPYMKDRIFQIPMTENDFAVAIELIRHWGLRFAAVTSPLKSMAQKLVESHEPINSLVFDGKWIGQNTDVDGLHSFIEDLKAFSNQEIVVWGGGGVLGSLRQVFTNIKYYSATTAQPRTDIDHAKNPQVLIWAAPRLQAVLLPSDHWDLKVVLDLNYTENSMGLEFAQQRNLDYVSGLKMFYAQAFKQRLFWNQNVKN